MGEDVIGAPAGPSGAPPALTGPDQDTPRGSADLERAGAPGDPPSAATPDPPVPPALLRRRRADPAPRGRGGADRSGRPPSEDPVLPGRPQTRALLQYGAAAVLALGLAAVAGGVASRTVAEHEAVSDAVLVTRVLTRTVIEPNLSDGLLSGEPDAVARLDELFLDKIIGEAVVRVKLWTPDGRILYSDDHRLLGRRYALEADQLDVLRTGRIEAEVSDLVRPENELDRHLGTLLEVYVPVHTPAGELLLFETYSRYSTVTERAGGIFWPIALVTLGALLLLEGVQIPLAWRTARQLDQVQQDRERLLHKAIASSRIERRRIAADLHERVVQDLAAVSFHLGGAASAVRDESGQAGRVLREGSAAVRGAIRSVRSVLVDIYPPSLHRTGLPAALHDLATPLTSRGVGVTVDIPADLALRPPDAELVYRVAQEALRNAATHARAATITVRIARTGSALVLTVEDDGRGFDVGAARAPGHLGLALLRDLATDAEATLEVRSEPGRGTTIRLDVPQ